MTLADLQYLADLVRAWAARADASVPAPLPVPDAVSPADVIRLMCAHNVEAALAPWLPPSARTDDLDRRCAVSRARTLDLLLECERILPAVGAAAERPLLLKGAALALEHYADPAQRWFLDLDILVPRDRVAAVCENLFDVGYRPLKTGMEARFYDRHHFHHILLGPSGACVEVHWALTLPKSVFRHDPGGLRDRARSSRARRNVVFTPSPADHLLHCAYQNIADGFVDLRRVLDQVRLIRSMTATDWSRVTDLAVATGLDRGLALSLHTVKQIAGISPPDTFDLERHLGSLACRTVRGLDPEQGCLDRRARRTIGYTRLLHLIATPGDALRWRELRRAEWWDEAALHENPGRFGEWSTWWPYLRTRSAQMSLIARVGWLAARAIVKG